MMLDTHLREAYQNSATMTELIAEDLRNDDRYLLHLPNLRKNLGQEPTYRPDVASLT